jgi:hypothetical protein
MTAEGKSLSPTIIISDPTENPKLVQNLKEKKQTNLLILKDLLKILKDKLYLLVSKQSISDEVLSTLMRKRKDSRDVNTVNTTPRRSVVEAEVNRDTNTPHSEVNRDTNTQHSAALNTFPSWDISTEKGIHIFFLFFGRITKGENIFFSFYLMFIASFYLKKMLLSKTFQILNSRFGILNFSFLNIQ